MRIIICILSLWLPVLSWAQKLSLSGMLKGLPDSTKIVLVDLQNPGTPLAETFSKSEAFTLSASLAEPSIIGLSIGDSTRTALFVGNEDVKLTGSLQQSPDEWEYTGSSIQNSFIDYQNTFAPKFKNLNALVMELQSQDGTLVGNKKLQDALDDIQNAVDAFIAKYPASPVSTLAILSIIGITDNTSLLEKRAKSLKEEALNNVLGQQLKKAIEDARFNAVGETALDFSQTDTAGNMVSLAQFRGKYVLVDFWASWCGPCRRENPFLVKVFEKYKDKNFTILGVSLDEDRDDWLDAIKNDVLKWTHVSDLKGWGNEVAVKYRISAIPRNFLIDPEGKIIARDLRGDALAEKLKTLFGE